MLFQAIDGVHYFFYEKDIPGKNNYYVVSIFGDEIPEEIFLTQGKPVLYHGQPVGIILADTFELANRAASMVNVKYEMSSTKPVLATLKAVIQNNSKDRFKPCFGTIVNESTGSNPVVHTFFNSFSMLGQHHFTMEPQTSICLPTDDGINVLAATQFVDFTQIAVASCLHLPNNSINMQTRRLGGAYGGKATHSAQVTCAAAIGCFLTNRPVRFVLTMESSTTIIGRRLGLYSEHTVHVDDHGAIQRLVNLYSQDKGCSLNEPIGSFSNGYLKNCYVTKNWSSTGELAITDAPSHTFCRGPGSVEGIAMIENIMDNIANRSGLDPVAVRLANIGKDHKMQQLLPEFAVDVGNTLSLLLIAFNII